MGVESALCCACIQAYARGVCVYVCVYVCVCTCVCTCVYMCARARACASVCMCMCVYLYVRACVCVCMVEGVWVLQDCKRSLFFVVAGLSARAKRFLCFNASECICMPVSTPHVHSHVAHCTRCASNPQSLSPHSLTSSPPHSSLNA